MATITPQAKNTVVDITGKIIGYGLPLLYFVISVMFYLRTYDSAQIKITMLQIGGAVLLGAWLVKVIEEHSWPFFRKHLVFFLPLLAFLASGILSYGHSPFPLASVNELIRRVFYIALAMIVIKEFNSEAKFRRLFNWLFAAAYVATVYGVIQYLDTRFFPGPPEPGLDPFIWRGAFGSRVFSTFGNPNFFGDFLVVMSPITLAMYMYTRRFHLLVLWLLIAFNTAFTFSKGAWLGFSAGLLVFAFLAVGFFSQGQKVKVRKLLVAMALITLVVVGLGMRSQLKGRPDSASFRVYTWLSTFEMIKTNPWLGTGIGTFYVTYPAWRRPQIFFIEGRHNTETDHPENEYLEVWYDEGLVGAGVFLWVLTLFLTLGFRSLSTFSRNNTGRAKSDIRAYYQLGLLTALAAQLVHNLVCVSLRFVSSGIFLWLLIGLIGALAVHHPLFRNDSDETPPPNGKTPPWRRALQFGVVAAAFFAIRTFYGYFDADVNHNMAIFYSKQSQWDQALKHYNRVVEQNPSFIMSHYFMGNVYNDRWGTGDADRSIGKYGDVWKLAPNYVQSHHQAGLIYLKWGEDEKRLADEARARGDRKTAKEHDDRKIEIWNKAMSEFEWYRRIDPIFPLNYYRMAWIYMQLGRNDKAEEMYLAHLNYPDKLKEAPHNAWVEDWAGRRAGERAETCVHLGNMRYMNNDLAGADRFYRQAVQLDGRSVNALKSLAMLCGRQGRMQEYQELWLKIRSIAPNDPDVQRVFQQQPPPGR